MKLAIIPPVRYLEEFSTNYHLVLAHIYKTNLKYRAFYLSRRRKGEFIILDNGAAEQGSSIDAQELYRLAIDLKPNVLVCPDALRDYDKTLTLANHFLDEYAPRIKELDVKLLAVPQGKTEGEWLKSFEWFNSDPTIEWLGISKYVVGAFQSRVHAMAAIEDSMKKHCHLLGMAGTPEDVIQEKRFKFAYSTDTAVPVKLGLQGLSLKQYAYKEQMSDDTYFLNPPEIPFTDYRYGWMRKNVDDYKGYCL
jgi:hypothetical protein